MTCYGKYHNDIGQAIVHCMVITKQVLDSLNMKHVKISWGWGPDDVTTGVRQPVIYLTIRVEDRRFLADSVCEALKDLYRAIGNKYGDPRIDLEMIGDGASPYEQVR